MGHGSSDDIVVDLGVGERVFAIASCERLTALGTEPSRSASQVYGAEADKDVFGRAQEAALKRLGHNLGNVVCASFYDTPLPLADAIVGNPPYIRRHYQDEPGAARVNSGIPNAQGLTDSYCYFLVRACKSLRPGGRLAVIVSASWLDMNYGRELKRLLLDDFRLRLILAFEGKVLPDALVKPVVILAEKAPGEGEVTFARLRPGIFLDDLGAELECLCSDQESGLAAVSRVGQHALSATVPWSVYLKTPEVYAALMGETRLVPLRRVALSRIGLQTFAKHFYIMTRRQAREWSIEDEYLLSLVSSPKETRSPILTDTASLRYLVLACDRPEKTLSGTYLGRYIARSMKTTVTIRGKDETVEGFHRLPRVARAHREPWYNLESSIEKRGTCPVLLPRRVFESYLVVHNRTTAVANEDFIELRPLSGEEDVEPLLTFLNSTIGELLVRLHGFQYGGGVFNLNPGAVRELPMIDTSTLSACDRDIVGRAWEAFVAGYGSPGVRSQLDQAVAQVLGISPDLQSRARDALALLTRLARSSIKTYKEVAPNVANGW